MHVDFNSFLEIVKEFIRALGERRSYNISKNWYCFFGILWGIPIPIVTIGIDLYSTGLAFNLSNIIHIFSSHPFHLFFLIHPFLFGIVFGAMGTVRYNKEQRIEESERLKSSFLSMVSHELRTPLTTIQGYISFLKNGKSGPLNQLQRDCLKTSEEEADLLNHLIEELLDLSKIETGEFKVHLEGIDMMDVIKKAIAALQLFADEQGVIIENNLPKTLPSAFADKERMLQVVTNIIKNAIKFNKRGGMVSVMASVLPEKIIFCISDTGIGIPEDKLDKVFDKFYQVDSSGTRRYGGCGLGLAISESILKLHNERIWVESELNVGSKFFFKLPQYNNRSIPVNITQR